MRQKGFPENELAKLEQELKEPPTYRIEAVRGLIEKQDVVGAEIAARMLVEDYPDYEAAGLLLQEVMEKVQAG